MSSSVKEMTAETVRLSIDDIPENKVETAGGNHAETTVRELSSIEQFFVRVANVYTHQQAEKVQVAPAFRKAHHCFAVQTKAEAAAAGVKPDQAQVPLFPFRSIEDKMK